MQLFESKHSTEGEYAIQSSLSRSEENRHSHRQKRRPDQTITAGLPFNYLPRGRVEIRKGGKAIIFCSPHICTEETKQLITEEFGLTAENGIANISLKSDGSAHYRCALDNE